MPALLEVQNISFAYVVETSFFRRKRQVLAAQNISFTLESGSVTALVGESGSGKSTIGKLVQGILTPQSGKIFFEGRDAQTLSRIERAAYAQTIFQDPYNALNPRLKIGAMLSEALRQKEPSLNKESCRIKSTQLLKNVGLPVDILEAYPYAFSGGQRQRLGLARALAVEPKLLICDEPVSALDVSIQAQILNLLTYVQKNLGIALLLITHDLLVVKHMAENVLVLENGRSAEIGRTQALFSSPQSQYTKNLLQSELSI